MDILSLEYLLFVTVGIALFYWIPQKIRPYLILFMSLLFVFASSLFGIFFILVTSFVVSKAAIKISENKNSKKRVLRWSIVMCLSILIVLKYVLSLPCFSNIVLCGYVHFNSFIRYFLYPAGISYYTLQILSYIVDVYWNRIQPEKSYLRLLTFTCFFPQLVQGPISKYGELAPEIFREHNFHWINLKYGIQLILWGMFKKICIADRIGNIIREIFYSNNTPYGFAVWFGLILYGVQLYCDFGGGIDIIRGVSECFDIPLKENFKRPYFSHSLGEFWRRWHISLGIWMKEYVFYPLSICKPMKYIKKQLKKIVSKKIANRIVAGLANVIVFMLVGIWHGTGTNFFAWGLYNGIILGATAILSEKYIKWKNIVKINENTVSWNLFTWLRTLFIVTVSWIFDCANTAGGSFRLLWNSFNLRKTNLLAFDLAKTDLFLIICFGMILLCVSVYTEKHEHDLKERIGKIKFWKQAIIWTILIQMILAWGTSSGGFMYANF